MFELLDLEPLFNNFLRMSPILKIPTSRIFSVDSTTGTCTILDFNNFLAISSISISGVAKTFGRSIITLASILDLVEDRNIISPLVIIPSRWVFDKTGIERYPPSLNIDLTFVNWVSTFTVTGSDVIISATLFKLFTLQIFFTLFA